MAVIELSDATMDAIAIIIESNAKRGIAVTPDRVIALALLTAVGAMLRTSVILTDSVIVQGALQTGDPRVN
jgi:hypothetical protein